MTKVDKSLLNNVFIEGISAGSGILVDSTDPANPVISSNAPDVAPQIQAYWMPSNLELSEFSSIPLLIGLGDGNGVFDGFNALTWVDVSNAINLNSSTPGQLTPNFIETNTTPVIPLNANVAGWPNYNVRFRIGSAILTTSGNRVRMTLQGSTSGVSLVISEMFIGHRASSGDEWDMDGTQVRVRVAGSNGFTVPANSTIQTDWVNYNLNEARDLIVSFHTVSGDIWSLSGANSNYSFTSKSGASEASVSDASGFTVSGSYSLGLIRQVFVSTGTPANMNVQSQTINLSEIPDFGRLVAIVNQNGTGINSEIVMSLSRNNGANFGTITLSEKFTRSDGSIYLDSGVFDLTSLPSGNSGKWRIQTLNNKGPVIKAIGVFFGKNS